MFRPSRLLLTALLLSSCHSPSRPSVLDAPPLVPQETGPDPRRTLAYYNGEALSWQTVAERVLELNPRDAVEKYVFWRVVHDEKKRQGIVNTPEELQARARVAVRQYREKIGDEAFRAELAAQNKTEDDLAAELSGRRNLSDTLGVEKLVVFTFLQEGAIDLDWLLFSKEEDARSFAEGFQTSPDFDKVYADTLSTATGKVQWIRTGFFSRDLHPPQIDNYILDRLFQLPEGSLSAVEPSHEGGLYYVFRVVRRSEKRPGTYAELAPEVFRRILDDPPQEEFLRRWAEQLFRRSKIEYEDRNSPRN